MKNQSPPEIQRTEIRCSVCRCHVEIDCGAHENVQYYPNHGIQTPSTIGDLCEECYQKAKTEDRLA